SLLQEEKSLTFLFRAPKVSLEPLPLTSIARSYAEIFSIDESSAAALAKATLGYAFAYQVLGTILFRDGKKEIDKKVNWELDELLQNRSYEIIWSECSQKEKEILFLIANGKTQNQEIQDALGISKGYLATYKDRLKKDGLIDVSSRGKNSFALPRFQQFVLLKQSLL
ncbi:MAG: winged helix-turn-helix transcriptional regulator, partial [Bacilli bacterium]|nr:winged helix-turn-helix transcriptional regulator [Bacilli bacterium]